MEEKKEFLTEENYEKSKKKILTIALVILIVGVLIGGSLIITGIIKTNQIKKYNQEVARQIDENDTSRTTEQIQADIDEIQTKIDEIDKEIATLKSDITKLQNEQTKIFQEDKSFSDRYNAKGEEIDNKQNEILTKSEERSKLESTMSEYEGELWKVNSGYNDAEKSINKSMNMVSENKYNHLYFIGGIIIVMCGIISLAIYLFAKRREIVAFKAQQIMPVAQEGLEKVAPTIGNVGSTITNKMAPAYGNVAKEITKGIKEGIQEGEELKKEENEEK